MSKSETDQAVREEMKKAIGLAALPWLVLSLSDPARSVGPYVPIGDRVDRVAAAELIVAGEVLGLQGVMGPKVKPPRTPRRFDRRTEEQ